MDDEILKRASAIIFCIVFVLQLLKSVSGQLVGNQSKGEVEHGKGIVYEVTGLRREDLNNTLENKSSLVYIVAYDDIYSDTCLEDEGLECGRNFGITSLSLLIPYSQFPLENTLQTSHFSSIANVMKGYGSTVHSLILSITKRVDGSRCHCRFFLLPHYLLNELQVVGSAERKVHFPVQLGLEYSEGVIDCCSGSVYLQRAVSFDLGVLRIDLSPHKDILSYGMFSQKLDDLVQKNRRFVNKFSSQGTSIVRLVFHPFPNITDQVNIRFRSMLTDYVKAWEEERNGTETIILEPFASENNKSVVSNNEFLRIRVTPFLQGGFLHNDVDFNWKLQGLPSIFQNYVVNFHNLDLNSTRILSRFGAISSQSTANYSISIPFYWNPIATAELVAEHAQVLNIHTVYFDVSTNSGSTWQHPPMTWNTSISNQVVNLLQSKNVQIGCQVGWIPVSDYNSSVSLFKIKQKCGVLLSVSSKILYKREIWIKEPEEFIRKLASLEQERRIIEEAFPGKESKPVIYLKNSVPETRSIYCSVNKQKDEEYYNMIIAYANIHAWQDLYMRDLVSDSDECMWRLIKTTEEMSQMSVRAPVYIRTNAAKSMGKDIRFPHTYPCIKWTEAEPEVQIGFLNNSYTGTTVNMDLKLQTELNAREVETLLLFAFSKFPTVELVARNEKDVAVASQVLTHNLLQYVSRLNKFSLHLVSLEIPINLAYHSANVLAKLPSNVSVHLSGWENRKNLINLGTLGNRRLGITVQDCEQEVNFNLTRMATLSFLPVVKYLVCAVKPVRPENHHKDFMTQYLNTVFYIKTYIQKFYPGMEVSFRLKFQDDTICDKKKLKVGHFLKFLNDVQQHGKAYKIRYFIVNAFEKEKRGQKCSHSWWRINNYTDLSSPLDYIDIENEYFGRETKLQPRPVITESGYKEKGGSNVASVVISSVLSALLFLSFLAFLVYRNRTRKQLLTLKEIHEFYNGTMNNDSDERREDQSRWLGMGFPETLQIAKNRIEIGRKIGSGEFGQVFLGMLDQQVEVAVKEPRHDSSVETFKSALSEVKILRFVGNGTNPNVISFLGAYTKEISKGKLYILTEYCENGSLLDLLKSLQSKGEANSQVDANLLCTFAFEIASGLEFIAEKKVIHGDLATRNVLLNSDYTCKIGDFGLSRKLYEYTKYVKESHQPMPWRWMAVESLKNMEFTTKSDVWSYGITVWEIFSLGATPYPGLSWNTGFVNQLINGTRLEKAEHASIVIHEKLLNCWRLEPEARPTFGELAQFFADLRGGSDTYTSLHELNSSDSNQVAESRM